MSPGKRLRRRLTTCARRYALVIAWVGVNNVIFWSTYFQYKREARHYYLRKMLGPGLCVSRATAAMLNVNCCLILLPMCRSLTTCLRSGNRMVTRRFLRSLIDKSKSIHIMIAMTIIFASVLHTIAHVLNAQSFSRNYNHKYPDINLAKYPGENSLFMIMKTVPGVTGLVMVIVLCLIVSSSVKPVRVRSYNVFWYTHHLFLVFLVLLIVHPMSGVLKEQINLDQHVPGCFQLNDSSSLSSSTPSWFYHSDLNVSESPEFVICQKPPQFVVQPSDTWMWVLMPLIVYLADAVYRMVQRRQEVRMIGIKEYPCKVLEIMLIQKGFHIRPGQFILIQCPAVSTFEWHPFTVTRCPSAADGSFAVHIRIQGDWTRNLRRHILEMYRWPGSDLKSEEIIHAMNYAVLDHRLPIKLYIDGPFCSPTEDVFRFPISVCIAGGIGVTPFAAILHYLLADNAPMMKLRRLHLIWLCREVEAFLWFAQLLCQLYHKLWYENKPDVLDIQLFLTRCRDLESVRNMLSNRFPLLAKRIECGRPNWKDVFKPWRMAYSGTTIGVFCCGPGILTRQIRQLCVSESYQGVEFRFHHESFS